jgi:prevent-host-death family protein
VPTEVGAHEFRNRFGWYMERSAAGEGILITRRGKPHARLGPAGQSSLEPLIPVSPSPHGALTAPQ